MILGKVYKTGLKTLRKRDYEAKIYDKLPQWKQEKIEKHQICWFS